MDCIPSEDSFEFKDTLLKSCNERGDAWAVIVKARVLHVHDLHAADAVYHQVCSVNFRTKKQMPAAHQTSETEVKKTKLGRPQDEERFNAFLEVANFLEENDNEQITINDLVSRMENNLKGSECQAYGDTQIKFKLKEQFGDRIIHTEINGKPNVVTFRSTAKAILQDFYAHRKADPETEKKRIIETAAKLIKNDIKSVETYHDVYPDCESLKSEEDAINFLPESLRVLLKGLLGVKKCRHENCLHRTSNHAGDQTKSYSGATADWARSPDPPPLCITLPWRYASHIHIRVEYFTQTHTSHIYIHIASLHTYTSLDSAAPTRRCKDLFAMLWCRLELTFLASPVSLSSMPLTMWTTTFAPWMATTPSMVWG